MNQYRKPGFGRAFAFLHVTQESTAKDNTEIQLFLKKKQEKQT